MANQIKIKRGLLENLPTLALGEMGFTTDTEDLYIGGNSGNVDITRKPIKNLNIYDVRIYGAIGDGVNDDRESLQNAIDACSNNGGGIVFIPANFTLLLNSNSGFMPSTSVKAMILLKSNVTIMGNGKTSIIKVADNYTDGGDYVIFANNNVDNLTLTNFKVDSNGENNTVIDSGVNVRRAYVVWLYVGNNILIDNVEVEKCPGRNVFNIAGLLNTHTIDNLTIRNCHIKYVGGTVVGNENQSDHSSLYIQATNLNVYNNIFENDPSYIDPSGVAPFGLTAIEIHEGGNVFNNKVFNYRLGAYVVNQAFEGYGYKYYNNDFEVTRTGIQIWATFKITDLSIFNNSINLFGQAQIYGIFQYTDTPTQFVVENLLIESNTIIFNNALATSVSGGLQLTAIKNGVIDNNIIQGCSGNCIYILPADVNKDIENIKITNNTFENYGFTTAGTAFWGIYVVGNATATIKQINVENNTFKNETLTTQRGIRLNDGNIEDVIIGNLNIFENVSIIFDQLNDTNHSNIVFLTLPIEGEFVFDPISLIDGAGQTSTSFVLNGVNFGSPIVVAPPYDLQGLIATAYVVGVNAVKIRVQNGTGVTVDLPSGTWKVKAI